MANIGDLALLPLDPINVFMDNSLKDSNQEILEEIQVKCQRINSLRKWTESDSLDERNNR